MQDMVRKSLADSILVHQALVELSDPIVKIAQVIIETIRSGGKVMVCGNGGSAADSQHIAAELVGRFCRERRALPAIALTTDTSILTSLSNDYCYEKIFSRQIEALGKPGDIIILISTSGNSGNLLSAIETAKGKKIKTISLLGKDGGKMAGISDWELIIPADNTARIQEGQITVYHILCDLVEAAFA